MDAIAGHKASQPIGHVHEGRYARKRSTIHEPKDQPKDFFTRSAGGVYIDFGERTAKECFICADRKRRWNAEGEGVNEATDGPKIQVLRNYLSVFHDFFTTFFIM